MCVCVLYGGVCVCGWVGGCVCGWVGGWVGVGGPAAAHARLACQPLCLAAPNGPPPLPCPNNNQGVLPGSEGRSGDWGGDSQKAGQAPRQHRLHVGMDGQVPQHPQEVAPHCGTRSWLLHGGEGGGGGGGGREGGAGKRGCSGTRVRSGAAAPSRLHRRRRRRLPTRVATPGSPPPCRWTWATSSAWR